MEEENNPQQERTVSPPISAELPRRPSLVQAAITSQPNLRTQDPSSIQGGRTSAHELSRTIPPQEREVPTSSAGPPTPSNIPVIKITLESSQYQPPQQEWFLESLEHVTTILPPEQRVAPTASADPSRLSNLPVIDIRLESLERQQEDPAVRPQRDLLPVSPSQVNTITPPRGRNASASSAGLSTHSNIPVIKIRLDFSECQQENPAVQPQPSAQDLTIKISVLQSSRRTEGEGAKSASLQNQSVTRNLSTFQPTISSPRTQRRPQPRRNSNVWQKMQEIQRRLCGSSEPVNNSREERNFFSRNSSLNEGVSTPDEVLIPFQQEGRRTTPLEDRSDMRNQTTLQSAIDPALTRLKSYTQADSLVQQTIDKLQQLLGMLSEPVQKQPTVPIDSCIASTGSNASIPTQDSTSTHSESVEGIIKGRKQSSSEVSRSRGDSADFEPYDEELDGPWQTDNLQSYQRYEQATERSTSTTAATERIPTDHLETTNSCFKVDGEQKNPAGSDQLVLPTPTQNTSNDSEMCEPGTSQPAGEPEGEINVVKDISYRIQMRLLRRLEFTHQESIDAYLQSLRPRLPSIAEERDLTPSSCENLPSTDRLPHLLSVEELERRKLSNPMFGGDGNFSTDSSTATETGPCPPTGRSTSRTTGSLEPTYPSTDTESEMPENEMSEQATISGGLPPAKGTSLPDNGAGTETVPSNVLRQSHVHGEIADVVSLGDETVQPAEQSMLICTRSRSCPGDTEVIREGSLPKRSQSCPPKLYDVPSASQPDRPQRPSFVRQDAQQNSVSSVSEENVDESGQQQRLSLIRQDAEQNPVSSVSEENVDESFVRQDTEQNPVPSVSEENVDEPGQPRRPSFVRQDAQQTPVPSVSEENVDEPSQPRRPSFVRQDAQQTPVPSVSEENVDEPGQQRRLSFVRQDAEQNPVLSVSEENVDEPGQPRRPDAEQSRDESGSTT